jgi:hypothetical protein
VSVSEALRALITEFYLPGTPLGKRLEELVPRVERLERTPPDAECADPEDDRP